jgi:nucleoside-diphosphate-sugar epimerase
MRAFVTGGTGIVGRNFLPQLLAAGWEVVALTRDPKKAGLLSHDRLTYLAGDLADADTVKRLLGLPARFDVVWHLAASLDYFGSLPELLATNAQGTEAMTRVARAVGASRFVYASSIEAAGAFSRSEIPAPPERLSRPLTAYGQSKRLAEQYVLAMSQHGIAPLCLRLGNVYGPGWHNFVVQFARSLRNRGKLWRFLSLYGERYWSPVWNGDVADGLLAAGTNTHAGVENLVGQAATVAEIFHLCADAMGVLFTCGQRRLGDWLHVCLKAHTQRWLGVGSAAEYGYLLAPGWPRIHRCFGMEDSARRLGLKPCLPLREGVAQTLKWARSAGLIHF